MMKHQQDQGSAKEPSQKADARDSNTSKGGRSTQQQDQQTPKSKVNGSSQQQGGSEKADHKMKEGLHQSVRKG